MAGTQIATALTSKSPGGVMVGIAGRIFFIIKFLNISRSLELEHALQTWKSNFVPIDFNFMMPSAVEENIPEFPVPLIFEKREIPASFLLNSWDNLVFIMIIILIFLALKITVLFIKQERALKILKKIKVQVQNYLITQLYAIYGDLIFFIILELRVIYLGEWTLGLSFAIETIFLVFIIVCFTLHFWLLFKYQKVKKESEMANNKEILQQFIDYYEGVKLLFTDFKDDSIIQHMFLIFITARDMMFSLVVTTLFELTIGQVFIFLVLNSSLLVYLVKKRPFKEKFDEIQQFVFEGIIVAVSSIEMFAAIIENSELYTHNMQIVLGKLLIIINIAFNICALAFMLLKIFSIFKEFYSGFKTKRLAKRKSVFPIRGDSSIEMEANDIPNAIKSSQVNDSSMLRLKNGNVDISVQDIDS